MERKVIESIKDLTEEDFNVVAKILIKTNNKYKEAYNFLKEKYNVKFTYNNFYNYVKRNELKIMKNAFLNLTTKQYEELAKKLEKDVEITMGKIIVLAQQCAEAKKDVLFLISKIEEVLEKTGYKDKELELRIKEIKETDKYSRIDSSDYLKSIAFLTILLTEIKKIPSFIEELQESLNNLNQN